MGIESSTKCIIRNNTPPNAETVFIQKFLKNYFISLKVARSIFNIRSKIIKEFNT